MHWKCADIPAPPDKITAAVEGDIEAIDKVLRITRIRVRYDLTVPKGKREAAERAVERHPRGCPAANSVAGCIDLDIKADITRGGVAAVERGGNLPRSSGVRGAAPAFEEARGAQVPVLLALGPRWCPATAAMMRGAYGDPRVADLLEERFVPIRVDAEARPDVGERYSLGGWPTTAFLTPDGHVLGGETYATAERMRGPAVARRRCVRGAAGRDPRAGRTTCCAACRPGRRGARSRYRCLGGRPASRASSTSGTVASAPGRSGCMPPPWSWRGAAPVTATRRSRPWSTARSTPWPGAGSTTTSTAAYFATARAATGPSRARRSCSTSTRRRSACSCCRTMTPVSIGPSAWSATCGGRWPT